MKKLLSLLSVLTISGTAVPTTIAASPYQKQETIKNNGINYQQTNNLEKLIRNKRENNNNNNNNNNKLNSWSCFLCPRRLSIEISHNNWEKIRIEHNNRTIRSLYNFVYNLFKNEFENFNNLTNNEVEILTNVVCDKFNDIDYIFKYKNNNNIGLIIRTNTNSYWSTTDIWWGTHLNKEINNNNYNGNELNFSGTRGSVDLFYLYFTFKPEFWEEVRFLYDEYKNNDDINSFANKFKEKAFNHKDSWIYYIVNFEGNRVVEFGRRIWNNWDSIDNLWQNSNRRNRIKLVGYFSATNSNDIYSKEILDDEVYRENKYLDNLEKDFPIWNSNTTINLGLIEDKIDNYILNKIKEKYPNLDIYKLSIEKVSEYSHINENFSAKIKTNNNKTNNNKYSHGTLKPSFTFNTKTKLKEISEQIKNNPLVKQWLDHLKDWSNDVKEELETSVPQKTQYEKNEWKNRKKENLKNYIRDWNYILNLIEKEWKIEELNKNVQGLKSNFENLKNQINNWDNKIKNLEGSTNNCESNGYVVSGTTGVLALFPIPVIQQIATVVSATSGAIAALCGLGI